MGNFPLISVIIPAYNAGRWLSDCVNSVIAQTYENTEIVIVDDGSTDDTFRIASKYAEKHKNIVAIHSENGGVCRARNYGIDRANGEYIAFLDADDMLMPRALETMYLRAVYDDADIVIGWKSNMNTNGTLLGCPYERLRAVWVKTRALEQSLLDHPATYAVWGKLYRKSIISDLRFVEGKCVHEDSFFVFQCFLKQPKVVVIDDIVLRYRVSENSASRSGFSEKFLDILYFAKRKKHIIAEQYPQYIELCENVLVKANMALLRNLAKKPDPSLRGLERECIQAVKLGKRNFHSAIKSDQQWFFIITKGLYPIYKRIRLFVR